MKPVFLFMCRIADRAEKTRIEQYVEVVEIESTALTDVLANVPGKEGLIVPFTGHRMVTPEVIDRGRSLKVVGTTYGGVRQNVDDEYAIRKGLIVIHTGAARQRPMAEFALSLVFSSLLQIHNYHHAMRSGREWPQNDFGRTRILSGRKVGIIGLGRIGSALLELMRYFTGDIAIWSSHVSETEARRRRSEKLTLDEVFEECEVIVLTGGYTQETHHMIGAEQFAKMQDGSLFVNVARGGMVDEEAMIRAVTERTIFLALDVFEREPLPADSPLRNNDRVLLTPHRGNNPIEFEHRWRVLADEIERYYTGGVPESALTLERARTMSDS